MRRWSITLLVAAALAVTAPHRTSGGEDGWTPLFNGKDLDNFVQHNGTAKYKIDGDAILGTTSEGSPNSFLCTKKTYGDFELKFEVKVDDALNSGVQIRSKSDPAKDKGRVHGPQVEIATNGTAGYLYGEALPGVGWLTREPGKDGPKPHEYFKKGEWNKYQVKAVGKHIQTWVNGQKVADYMDDKTGMMSGFIGLQVHSIGKGQGPYEVRWKNLHIKDLSKSTDK